MNIISRLCEVDGCERKRKAHGYCRRHLRRYKLYGDPLVVKGQWKKHGLSKTDLYRTWKGMKQRCYNRNSINYKNYGGRGITICQQWSNNFASFHDDVSPKPQGLTLDRKDNDGGYWCGKCEDCKQHGWPKNWRWGTRSEQGINQRISSINTSGHKGISLREDGKWRARIGANGKRVHLGYFTTMQEAIHAYEMAAQRYYG